MMCDRCLGHADFICIEGPEHHAPLMLEGYAPDPWVVRVLCSEHTDFDFWSEIAPMSHPATKRVQRRVRELALA